MLAIGIYFALCALVAHYAGKKGLTQFGYFFVSAFFTPIIGAVAVALASPNKQRMEQDSIASGENQKCPFCAEIIKSEATVCRYCGRDLVLGRFRA